MSDNEEKLDKDTLEAMSRDAFLQAQDGYEIELDPELADYMGAFVEDAISSDEIDADNALRASMGMDKENEQ